MQVVRRHAQRGARSSSTWAYSDPSGPISCSCSASHFTAPEGAEGVQEARREDSCCLEADKDQRT